MQLAVSRTHAAREVLSSSELLSITGALNPYDLTEMHCNEYYPNSTAESLTTTFASTAYLATLLLESWAIFLGMLHMPCMLTALHSCLLQITFPI